MPKVSDFERIEVKRKEILERMLKYNKAPLRRFCLLMEMNFDGTGIDCRCEMGDSVF